MTPLETVSYARSLIKEERPPQLDHPDVDERDLVIQELCRIIEAIEHMYYYPKFDNKFLYNDEGLL
jgi:hypothetical protein